MTIHRVVSTVAIGMIIYYIDIDHIIYIRKYMKVNTRSMGMIHTVPVEDIEMVKLHLTSGDVLEFNSDTIGISDLVHDFYSVTGHNL